MFISKSNFQKKAIVSSVLFAVIFATATAQQGTLYDLTKLYRFNWLYLNPAAINHINLEDNSQKLIFNVSRRNQWYNFSQGSTTGEPVVNNVRGEYINDKLRIKVGGLFHQYEVEPHQEHLRTQGSFSYIFPLREGVDLSIGFNVGIETFRLKNLSDINWIGEDWSQSFESDVYNRSYLDVSFGAFFLRDFQLLKDYPSNKLFDTLMRYFIGLSLPKSNLHDLIIGDNGNANLRLNTDIDRGQPLYLLSGMTFGLNDEKNLSCETTMWLRWIFGDGLANSGVPNSMDLNFKFQYYSDIDEKSFGAWVGFGGGFYRDRVDQDAIAAGFGSGSLFAGTRNLQTEVGISKGIKYGDDNSGGNNFFINLGLGMDFNLGPLSNFGPSYEISFGLAYSL